MGKKNGGQKILAFRFETVSDIMHRLEMSHGLIFFWEKKAHAGFGSHGVVRTRKILVFMLLKEELLGLTFLACLFVTFRRV